MSEVVDVPVVHSAQVIRLNMLVQCSTFLHTAEIERIHLSIQYWCLSTQTSNCDNGCMPVLHYGFFGDIPLSDTLAFSIENV